jgi:hypothetical protein
MSGMGVIQGGWEFVWAAYGISAAVLLGYGATLVLRLRAEQVRAKRAESRAQEVSS